MDRTDGLTCLLLVLLQWIHFDRFLHPRLRALEIRALWLGTGHMPTAWLGIEGSGESGVMWFMGLQRVGQDFAQ